ncbi:MAG: hypothetical protein ACXWJA_07445 [Caldimonas sp.]
MKLAVALSILLVGLPAAAQIQIPRHIAVPAEEESPTAPREINVRATHVNRCLDAKGGIVLQDGPCLPTPAPAASVAAGDVVELSSLAPRPRAEAASAAGEDTATGRLAKGLINGSWKLALLVLACYGLFRLARVWRDRHRVRQLPVDSGMRGPRRVR